MKTKRNLVQVCLLGALMWAFPDAVRAQYTLTTNGGAVTITGYTGPGGAVNIPDTIHGFPVVSIGQNAFIEISSLTSVMIPSSVTSIGYEAFGMCTNLADAEIPNTVTNMADYVFFKCSALTNVTIPSGLTVIKSEAFGLCSGLTNVTIPQAVTNIQSGAFEDCSSLVGIYFLGNPPTLGTGALLGINASATVYYLAGATGWGTTFDNFPTVELSPAPQISGVGVEGNEFGFTVTGTNTQVIVVEVCTNLAPANWLALQTNTLSGTNFNFTDSQWKNYRCRFYRLRSP